MKFNHRITHFINRLKFKGYKKFDGYLRIYLTLECNLSCHYCVNQCHTQKRLKDNTLVSGKNWVDTINKIGRNVIFTGGEPTLHPDFFLIMTSINPEIKIKLYTNLIWTEEFTNHFLKTVPKTIGLYTSYHPSGGKPEPFINRVVQLKQNNFNVRVHSINHETQKKFIQKSKQLFFESGIDLTIDEDQKELFSDASSQKQKRSVICSKKIILISPDGYRYPCVSKMVRKKNPLEHIIRDDLNASKIISSCNEYGYCAACDMLGEVTIKNSKK